jgi:hypothetical protein
VWCVQPPISVRPPRHRPSNRQRAHPAASRASLRLNPHPPVRWELISYSSLTFLAGILGLLVALVKPRKKKVTLSLPAKDPPVSPSSGISPLKARPSLKSSVLVTTHLSRVCVVGSEPCKAQLARRETAQPAVGRQSCACVAPVLSPPARRSCSRFNRSRHASSVLSHARPDALRLAITCAQAIADRAHTRRRGLRSPLERACVRTHSTPARRACSFFRTCLKHEWLTCASRSRRAPKLLFKKR